MEEMLSVALGIGLAAACGFRVFVPLLVISVAAKCGHLSLADSFTWIASTPALICFAVATGLEIAAYYVPWLDNLLDAIASPAAVVAGIVVTAACVKGMSPFLQWSLAIIAGGGSAAAVQGITVVTRLTSSLTSGSLANPLVATVEAAASIVLSLLALFLPASAGIVALLCVIYAIRYLCVRLACFGKA